MLEQLKAKEALKLAIKLNRRDTSLALLAQVFLAENDPVSAIEAYKAAIESAHTSLHSPSLTHSHLLIPG